MPRLAVLSDVHGNLAALETVVAEAERAGVTEYVLGGDYATFGPWPRETAERLEAVPAIVRIRGNVERWLREEPEVPPPAQPLVTAAVAAAQEALGPETSTWPRASSTTTLPKPIGPRSLLDAAAAAGSTTGSRARPAITAANAVRLR